MPFLPPNQQCESTEGTDISQLNLPHRTNYQKVEKRNTRKEPEVDSRDDGKHTERNDLQNTCNSNTQDCHCILSLLFMTCRQIRWPDIFSKIQIGRTFLVLAHLRSPGKRAVKWLCVFYGLYKYTDLLLITYYNVYSLTGQCYELNIPSMWTLCARCNQLHTRDDNTGSAAVQNSVHHTADCTTALSLKYSQRWHLTLLLLATAI